MVKMEFSESIDNQRRVDLSDWSFFTAHCMINGSDSDYIDIFVTYWQCGIY